MSYRFENYIATKANQMVVILHCVSKLFSYLSIHRLYQEKDSSREAYSDHTPPPLHAADTRRSPEKYKTSTESLE